MNKLFMIVLIHNMDLIIVIGRLNVFNYFAKLEGQDLNKIVDYYMEIQEFYLFYIIMNQELFVMMVLMIILLLLLVLNYMDRAHQLFHGLVDMLVIIKISGQMMLFVNQEWKDQFNANILNGDNIIVIHPLNVYKYSVLVMGLRYNI